MNNLKKNIKLIVLIIIIILISSGVGVFATYNYLASDIKYTDNKTVEQALDDLYNKSSNYILPSGTKTITTKESNIDVSQYQYVDTTGLYTASEIQSGKGTHWNSGSFTSVAGVNSINIGFTPNRLTIIRSDGNVGYAYNSLVSTSIVSKFTYISDSENNTIKVNVLSSGTPTSQQIIIGSTSKIYIGTANNTWYWFATE